MLRFAIVLCAALFASPAYAHVWSESVSDVLLKVHEDINVTISKLQEIFEVTQANNKEITKYLLNKTAEFKKKIMDKINTEMLKIGSMADNFTYIGNGFDIIDCFEYVDNLNDTANGVISNTSICIDDRQKTGLDDIARIDKLFKKEFAKLKAIHQEAEECNRNISDVESSVAAMSCIETAGDKANRIFPTFTRKLSIKVNSLNLFFVIFKSSLEYCTNADKIADFHQMASSTRENINKCAQEKIDSRNQPN